MTIKFTVVEIIKEAHFLLSRLDPGGRFTCGVGKDEDEHSEEIQR